jgi:cell division inhibitor SepF
MSLWKRTMDYLGLSPDDAYDDYDGYDEPEAPRQQRAPKDSEQRSQRGWEPEPEPTVRTVNARPSFPSKDFDASPSRRQASSNSGRHDDSGVQIRPSQSSQPALRSVQGSSMEPSTVRPRRFDQAQEVADKFKDGQPVIMNLEGTEREVARRLIDFASGICYALDGSMEKVATGVYLLKPPVAGRQQRYDDADE